MAEAFICDRCRCYCDAAFEDGNQSKLKAQFRIVDRSRSGIHTVYLSLCPICSDELHEFVNGAPEKRRNGVYMPPIKDSEGDDT